MSRWWLVEDAAGGQHSCRLLYLLVAVVLFGCSTEPENEPPTAVFSVTPSTGTTETEFYFDAMESSDPDDEMRFLQVRWDWDGDEVWDTIWGAAKTRTHRFAAEGNYTVVMEIRDSWGETSTATQEIPVGSQPVAVLIAIPVSGTTDTIFTFDASGSSDPGGDDSDLQFHWDWEMDGMWDVDWSSNNIRQHQYTQEGSYTVLLEVRNSDAVIDTATASVQVYPANSAPSATFTVTPESASYSQEFTFDASASSDPQDPAGDLMVCWDWDSDGSPDTNWSTTKITTHQFQQPGTFSVTLRVRDTDGFIGSAYHEVEATNSSPVAAFTWNPTSGDGYTEFTFDASDCTDPDSAPETLSVRWDWENNGVWDADWSEAKSDTHTFGSAGVYSVKLEVRDPFDLTATTTADVAVSNSPPIAAFSVTPSEGDVTTTFDFDASSCSDPEDGVASLEVRWDLEGDGTWDTTWSTVKTISRIYADPSFYLPSVEVRDTEGLSDTLSVQLKVTPHILWSVPLTSAGTAPAIAPDGTIYTSLTGGEVVGIASGGTIIRNLSADGPILGAPAIDSSGTVYFGSDDTNVYAYAADGSLLWKFPGGAEFRTSPSIGEDGTIYIGCDNGILYAINPDGSRKWTFNAGSKILNDPVIAVNGTVYISANTGKIHAVNPDSTEQWNLKVGGLPDGFVIDSNGDLVAVTGGYLRRIPPDGSGYSSLSVPASSDLVIGPDGTMYWRTNNAVMAYGAWYCETGIVSDAMPLVSSDGTIYSGFEAVSSNGKFLWSMGKSSSVASSLYNGLLYVVSNEPVLYAIEVSSQSIADGVWPKYKNDLRNAGRGK